MRILLLGLTMSALPASACADAFDVYGIWLTQAEDAHIEVTDCGDGTPCGDLVWVDPITAESQQDIRNDNSEQRGRPLIGVPIVWGYVRGRKNWHNGHIYNPEYGKTYASSMRLQKDGTLKVKGCLGPICITNIWTPAQTRMKEQ